MNIDKLRALIPIKRFREPRPPVVAVLRLSGVVGSMGPLRQGLTLARLTHQIERAFKLKRLEAVALSVNCPGGSPVQSALIAQRIRDLAEEKEIRVFAFTEDVAASGGYWIACAADEIFANDNSIVGSIGVISAGFGFQEVLKRFGIERRIHTAGDKKSLLDPFLEEDPKDVIRLRAVQKEIHENFKKLVLDRRGDRLKAAQKTLFSGEFWTGRKGLELGLVDGIGELRQVMRARYGKKVQLKAIDGPRSFWRSRLRLEAGVPSPEGWASGLLFAVEERALWTRYGL